jgi:Amt family ammonium transporter
MLATLCVLSLAALAFVLIGSSFAGFPGGPARVLTMAGIPWNWLGQGPLFGQGLGQAGIRGGLTLCLQMFTVGLAAIIPLSAGGDRWRLAPICLSTVCFASFIYPLFSHWVWGGGWLAALATNFGGPSAIAPFLDAGGASVIHVPGGLAALSVAWILGPRRGKYTPDHMATAIPGHNIVLVLFGCLIALVGFIGVEAAASMLLYPQPQDAALSLVLAVLVNATLSASAGCLAAVLTTQLRYRKPDASLSANGWVAGLVAGSAACGFVSPLVAVFVAAVAGLMTPLLVEALELRLLIDDPGGAISVHAASGLWGLLAAGIFARNPAGSLGYFLLSQLIGIATLIGLLLPLIHGLNLLLNRFVPYRVDRDGDWQGMDIRELGAGAYPEFVIHADEFVPR